MAFSWWLVAILATYSSTWFESSEAIIPSKTFKDVQLFMNTSDQIFHMELDKYKDDGSILISSNKHLQTTNGKETSNLLSFLITSFTQGETTLVYIVDHYRHCIKKFNRKKSKLRTLAGTCATSGYAEGTVGVGRLNRPWGVVIDIRNPDKLLVTDRNNYALRSVDVKTGKLSTVIRLHGLFLPNSLVWAGNDLLVTNYFSISRVSWLTNNQARNTHLVGTTTSGHKLGSFNTAQFSSIVQIAKLEEGKYMVADYGSKRLKLLDMNKRVVGLVCIRESVTESCELSESPLSMLSVGETLYVGTDTRIYELKEKKIRKRLVFKADFDIACYAVIENSAGRKAKMKEIMLTRRTLLQDICAQNCTMSTTLQPSYECRREYLLIQYWPTDTFYPASITEPPQALFHELKNRLGASTLMKALGVYPILSEPVIV